MENKNSKQKDRYKIDILQFLHIIFTTYKYNSPHDRELFKADISGVMGFTVYLFMKKKGGDSMGDLINIYEPIKDELKEVDMIIKNVGNSMASNSTQEVVNHFFRTTGKYLRPTLILLSAKAVNPFLTLDQKSQLIQLSVAVELIHSASLIHDDIIDGDLLRRGQKTLNNVYGRKIAVLAGDTLYAKAFSILSGYLPREAEQIITQTIEKMCMAEIDQAREEAVSEQSYYKIIEGKTASFMSASCRLGALLAGAEKEDITAMENFGLYLGMVYQIVDDCTDDDPYAIKNVTMEDAQRFANMAAGAVDSIGSSVYKHGLLSLLENILSISKSNVKA